jgi:hypothetical protein
MILLEVDPNWVKPGWMLVVTLVLLAGAMVLLYRSMRKQFRKIRTPDDGESDNNAEDSSPERPPTTPS